MNILLLTYNYLTQPLGIAYLSGALLREFKPDVLCLSLITGQHPLFFRWPKNNIRT